MDFPLLLVWFRPTLSPPRPGCRSTIRPTKVQCLSELIDSPRCAAVEARPIADIGQHQPRYQILAQLGSPSNEPRSLKTRTRLPLWMSRSSASLGWISTSVRPAERAGAARCHIACSERMRLGGDMLKGKRFARSGWTRGIRKAGYSRAADRPARPVACPRTSTAIPNDEIAVLGRARFELALPDGVLKCRWRAEHACPGPDIEAHVAPPLSRSSVIPWSCGALQS